MAILQNFNFYNTPPLPVAVETNDTTNRSYTEARLNGNLTCVGGEAEVDVWFQYWEFASGGGVPSGYSETSKQLKTSIGTFFADISSLTQGTTYEFRAVAQGRDSGSTEKYGNILTFTTRNKIDVLLEDTINLSDDCKSKLSVRLDDSLNLSDEIAIKLAGVWQEDELKDAITLTDAIEILVTQHSNIDNDFRSCIEVLNNIDNKFNTVIESLNDCSNVFSFAFGKTCDIVTHNDFRTYAIATPFFDNDFRMLLPIQEPPKPEVGFQSLGKKYIKVYIASVEQTDVDIDSIIINKSLNISHTASFMLGRSYDDTKPDMDAIVEIKYHIWTLYKGYITTVTPGNTPESIRIGCKDEFWKQNRTKKYFFVGHEPSDNEDKYYETIAEGLTSVGAGFGIGDFVPQTMNCFGTGTSDCITNLLMNAGNYSWFYDEAGNKLLHTDGQGSVVELERQEIGKQLGLYQVLSHSFNDDVSAIINKLRVTMGDKVVRSFTEVDGTVSKTYSGYNYTYYEDEAIYDWDNSYEILAKDASEGYGYDYHKSEKEKYYKNVFKRYKLPYLDPRLASWSDRRKPVVVIYGSGYLSVPLEKVSTGSWVTEYGLKDGFTIDYEDGTLTFNESIFCYSLNEYGECTNIWRPIVELRLWKKNYYSYTADPSDNPEDPGDITSPLIFITDKMGTYSETIFSSLELGGLSIQEGGSYQDENDEWVEVPSWDDTDFAKDYADWQLSKTCDKKIVGTIGLTLDAVCQYEIDLAKRINIEGVTEQSMNIESITYNINSFVVTIELRNGRTYSRSASLPSHGE